jgi:hypothetical protein
MDPVVARLINYLEGEWHVVRRAPVALTLIALIVGALVWLGTSMYYASFYEGTIRESDAALKAVEKQRDLAQDQARELQSQLSKAPQRSRPYTIGKEDEVEFIQKLSSAGQYEVVIEHLSGNRKALTLAQRIFSVSESSGWRIRSFDTAVIGGNPPTGVILRVNKGNGIPLGAALLRALLTKRNIETQIQEFSPGEGEPRFLKIFVGPDPQDINE